MYILIQVFNLITKRATVNYEPPAMTFVLSPQIRERRRQRLNATLDIFLLTLRKLTLDLCHDLCLKNQALYSRLLRENWVSTNFLLPAYKKRRRVCELKSVPGNKKKMPADKSLSTETETRSDGTDYIRINARHLFPSSVVLFYARIQGCEIYFYIISKQVFLYFYSLCLYQAKNPSNPLYNVAQLNTSTSYQNT